MAKRYIVILAAALLVVLLATAAGRVAAPLWHRNPHRISQTSTGNKQAQQVGFDTHAHSTADPASLWVVVNKRHPLTPKAYVPARLTVPDIPLRNNITNDERQVSNVVAPALEHMVADAGSQGVYLNLQSGYRSYSFQVSLYNSYVRSQGQAAADRQSARPGYSEHQSGLAADLGGTSQPACNIAACFGETKEGKWLAAHAYTYGFIIRYPAGKEQTTGYEYEPWHVRYVGTALANEMHRRNIQTLEEFFGISGGTQYQLGAL
jgi:D-alanyl-D-alanine carboxypeptidase